MHHVIYDIFDNSIQWFSESYYDFGNAKSVLTVINDNGVFSLKEIEYHNRPIKLPIHSFNSVGWKLSWRNTPKEIAEASKLLIEYIYNNCNYKYKAKTVTDAYYLAREQFNNQYSHDNEIGHIFGSVAGPTIDGDIRKSQIAYDFDRRFITIKSIPKNILAFSSEPLHFGVLAISDANEHNQRQFSMATINDKNFIVVECEEI